MHNMQSSFFESALFHPVVGLEAVTDSWFIAVILGPVLLAIALPTLLTLVPHKGSPQQWKPRGPPEEKAWRAMTFMERVDHCVHDIAAHSLDVGLTTYWKHIRFWLLGCAFNFVVLALVPRPEDMSLDEWAKQACIKSIILHEVGEGMGFFKQGPLSGNRDWPDAWKYQLTPGSIKQPLWGQAGNFKGFWGPAGEQEDRFPVMTYLFGGTKRTYLDCIMHLVFFMFAIVGQFLPRMPMWWVWVINATCLWCMIFDFTLWLNRVGYTYMYFLIAAGFPADRGALAGMQIVMLFQRLGCGLGKFGPWFCYVIGIFIQTHPTAKDSENYRSFIHRGPDNLGPSKAAKRMGYFAEFWETFWPFVVLMTFSPFLCRVGLAGLVAMHTFIIIAPAMIDVVMWNVAFIIADIWMFSYASCGFSWSSLSQMHPLLGMLLLGDLVCTTLLMDYPKITSRYFRHAHYTGNWPQMNFIVKKTAAEKIHSRIKSHGNKAWNGISQGTLTSEYKMYKGVSYSWLMSLDAKFFPLLHDMALKLNEEMIENYYIIGGHHFMEYVSGAGCDGQQGPRMARCLAKECELEPKDLMVVWIWPFPVFQAWLDPQNCKAEWEIQDSTRTEPLAQGSVSVRECEMVDACVLDSERLFPCLTSHQHCDN